MASITRAPKLTRHDAKVTLTWPQYGATKRECWLWGVLVSSPVWIALGMILDHILSRMIGF